MVLNVHRDRSGEIDEGLVLAAVEHAIGVRPVALSARETVAPRFVWEAQLAGGRAVYVKAECDAEGDEAILLEAWAHDRVRALGVPAAEVIALDSSETVFPGPVMILSKVEGEPLAPTWRPREAGEASLTRDQLAQVWSEVGRHLSAIHSIALPGFGRLADPHYRATGEVRGAQATWPGYALAPAEAALANPAFVRAAPAGLVQHATRALEANRRVFDAVADGRLLHGDVGAKHVIVDPATGLLNGILDFGDRESGDPAWDLANILLWEDDERLDWTLAGYGDGPGLRQRIAIYAIADGLRLAHKRVSQGRPGAADPVFAWLLPRLEAFARA